MFRISFPKRFLTPLLLGICCANANAAEISHPKGIVELFTSQGCHSCPPADKLMGKLLEEEQVLGISWHVNYWDYLGWKDTFATEENTERQYRYAAAMRERRVYTPQAVINGRVHAVGSNEKQVRHLVASLERTDKGLLVPIDVTIKNDSLSVAIPPDSNNTNATIYLVSMKSKEDVEIPRGENRGKTLSYHSIAKKIQMLGMVNANGFSGEFPLIKFKHDKYDSYAFIVQQSDNNGNPKAIIGAAYIKDL